MRKRIAAAVVTAALAATGFAGTVQAQTKYERWIDASGQKGIAFGGLAAKKAKCTTGVKVVLRRIFPNETTEIVAVTKSDSNGEFGIQGLDAGVYFFKAPKVKKGSVTCLATTSGKVEVE